MNKLSGKAAELTKSEWRDLGFYYISHEDKRTWELHGSQKGLINLCSLLREFADADYKLCHHEHLLPHWYLTITLTDSFAINERGIEGTSRQLNEFADTLEHEFSEAVIHVISTISKCAYETEYKIEYTVHGDDFDPSLKDPQL